jgi:TonB-dependent receptor
MMAMLVGVRAAWIVAGSMGLVAAAPLALAQEARIGFAIAAGPASQSVPEFAKQANLTVLATAETLRNARTNDLHGRFGAGEALAKLLAGTGLVAQFKDNGSVLLAPMQAAAPAAVDRAGAARANAEADAEPVPVVLVSTRRAQQSSIQRKQTAATAIDSIVAEDVGTLPDHNIGEAISRIAGVALNRGEFGEGIDVIVRGNGADLTRVELDGQNVRSAGGSDMNGGGDGRGTEFRQLSADLIKSVDVVKGATADMTEGALGGSVVIRTRSALELPRPFISLRAAGSRNNLNGRLDPDANLIAAAKFLDGRLGVLLNASAVRLTNESHQFQVSANGRDGAMRVIDFDNSPEKTFTYHPETVDTADPASTRPWATYAGWKSSTPLEIVARSAAAQSKQDCYAAFPVLSTASPELAALGTTNRTNAINARNQELLSCLNQWNDTMPALLRYFVKRQVDERGNLDLRTDFKVNSRLTLHAKGSYSRRTVDDNAITYSLGNASVNADSGKYVDSAAGVRTAVPGSGYGTFPYAVSLVSGKAPVSGAVANIDPASVVVDANHHVTAYTLQNASGGVDQIRNRMGTTTRYLQLGGAWKDGPFDAEFFAGDMRSVFWRADQRTGWGYAYGNAAVSLQPNGIWAYAVPSGASLDDWGQAAALLPATAPGRAQFTVAPAIFYIPQLRETGERTARFDLGYALPESVPLFKRLKAGYNLRDTTSDAWNGGGYTVTPAVGTAGAPGYVPAVTVPGSRVSGSLVGCVDTAGSLGPGGTPCTYGVLPSAGTRSYQIVLTQQQFRDAILGAMGAPATATQLFNGASGRPDALIDNWRQIDVEKLFASIGAPNRNVDCMKRCVGSDGKLYDQPVTAIRERTDAGYLMADFGFDRLPFGWEIEGNLGYRLVRNRVAGTGSMTFISKLKTAAYDPANPGADGGTTATQVTRNTHIDATTRDFLPVYNLAWWLVPEQVVVRYSRAKAVARPGASKLVASGSCTYDETLVDAGGVPTTDMLCTTVGNPGLRAQASINRNLSVEWYPNKDTMFSAAAYKQAGTAGAPVIDNVGGVKLFDGSDAVDPASGRALADLPFAVTTWVNGPPATRTGVEFGIKTAFTFLPWRLRHIGLDADFMRQHVNQTRLAWDLLTGDALPPRGEPRYAYNWALWYDDGAWRARLAVQTVGPMFTCIAPCGDTPLGYTLNAYPNASLAAKNPGYNPGMPNYVDRTSYVDAKLSYRWRPNLELFVEARNLTNQTQTMSLGSSDYADGTPNLQSYYYPGRRVTMGLVFHYR